MGVVDLEERWVRYFRVGGGEGIGAERKRTLKGLVELMYGDKGVCCIERGLV